LFLNKLKYTFKYILNHCALTTVCYALTLKCMNVLAIIIGDLDWVFSVPNLNQHKWISTYHKLIKLSWLQLQKNKIKHNLLFFIAWKGQFEQNFIPSPSLSSSELISLYIQDLAHIRDLQHHFQHLQNQYLIGDRFFTRSTIKWQWHCYLIAEPFQVLLFFCFLPAVTLSKNITSSLIKKCTHTVRHLGSLATP